MAVFATLPNCLGRYCANYLADQDPAKCKIVVSKRTNPDVAKALLECFPGGGGDGQLLGSAIGSGQPEMETSRTAAMQNDEEIERLEGQRSFSCRKDLSH